LQANGANGVNTKNMFTNPINIQKGQTASTLGAELHYSNIKLLHWKVLNE